MERGGATQSSGTIDESDGWSGVWTNNLICRPRDRTLNFCSSLSSSSSVRLPRPRNRVPFPSSFLSLLPFYTWYSWGSDLRFSLFPLFRDRSCCFRCSGERNIHFPTRAHTLCRRCAWSLLINISTRAAAKVFRDEERDVSSMLAKYLLSCWFGF